MKAAKILGGIVGVLALGAGGFWFFMLRHPSAEEVCSHIVEIAKKEGIPGADSADFKTECLANSKPGMTQGAVKFAKEMKCAAAITTMADLEKCN